MDTTDERFDAFRDWLTLRNYAASTKNSYLSRLRQFLLWRHRGGWSGPITEDQLRNYLVERTESGLNWSSINGDYSALQTYLTQILRQDWPLEQLARPRAEKSLPTIVSVQEVERLINAGSQLKHQAFMAFLYGTGLRLSEALRVRIADIDGDRGQLRVVKGKGKKDRYIWLPASLLELLRTYFRACRPQNYLFNGHRPGSQWANRAAQYAIEKAAISAGIIRSVSPHVLRHSYATHHLEAGTNILFIKEQLGHKNLTTTARYLHLCANYEQKVSHPLGALGLILRPGPAAAAE